MAGLGLEYDSSVFPQWLSESRPVFPHRVKTETGATIWEIPATTYPFLASRVPVAGGVYFRFFPAGVTHAAFAACERRGRPAMIYLHPYDVDADCPRPPGGNPLFEWFRYWGVATTFDRLRGMLGRYRFSPIIDYLHDAEKQSSPAARP